WTVLLGRLLDSGGQLLVATTPIKGHWLKEDVYDAGKPYDEIGPDDEIVRLDFRIERNPWISRKEHKRTEKVLADEATAAREFGGLWVGKGKTLWGHYDPVRHLRD